MPVSTAILVRDLCALVSMDNPLRRRITVSSLSARVTITECRNFGNGDV